jgi:hypothetical protein
MEEVLVNIIDRTYVKPLSKICMILPVIFANCSAKLATSSTEEKKVQGFFCACSWVEEEIMK